jgi:hypothetical protein
MKMSEEDTIPSINNSLKRRHPELIKSFTGFRYGIGDVLLDSLAPVLADPEVRRRHAPDLLADLHAVAQVLRVLVKDRWTEQDFATFDRYWRYAVRSDLFAEQFEAERHRIRAAVESARTKLVKPPVTTSALARLLL